MTIEELRAWLDAPTTPCHLYEEYDQPYEGEYDGAVSCVRVAVRAQDVAARFGVTLGQAYVAMRRLGSWENKACRRFGMLSRWWLRTSEEEV